MKNGTPDGGAIKALGGIIELALDVKARWQVPADDH
jgi:hypothetical protein